MAVVGKLKRWHTLYHVQRLNEPSNWPPWCYSKYGSSMGPQRQLCLTKAVFSSCRSQQQTPWNPTTLVYGVPLIHWWMIRNNQQGCLTVCQSYLSVLPSLLGSPDANVWVCVPQQELCLHWSVPIEGKLGMNVPETYFRCWGTTQTGWGVPIQTAQDQWIGSSTKTSLIHYNLI